MFLDINQLLQGKVRFNESFPPGAVEFFDPQLRQSAPMEVSGVAELTEALMEIHLKGHLKTRMGVACDRCLEPTEFPIDADFDLTYQPTGSEPARPEVKVDDGDVEIGFYEGNGLELCDVFREQVLLALPMQRVCRDDCKGICPICGQNRNAAECACQPRVADDRWAGLKDL
jgi:uncharacterized protein